MHPESFSEGSGDGVVNTGERLRNVDVTLRILGRDLNPDEVSESLHLSPTRAFRRGDVFMAGGRPQPRAHGAWMLSTRDAIDSGNLVDHGKCLLAWALPAREQLKNLLAHEDVQATITFWWEPTDGAVCFAFPSPEIRMIGELCSEVDFYFYCRRKQRSKKVGLALEILGRDLNPDEVTAALRLSPTRAFRKGDVCIADGGSRPCEHGAWMLSTQDAVESEDIVSHGRRLLAWVFPVQEQLRSLLSHGERRAATKLWWEPTDGPVGFTFPSAELKMLAELCNTIDFYFG